MTNLCMFYRSPQGCSRGSRCGFFHLNREKERIVDEGRRQNTHAFTHVCVAALFDNCSNKSCLYLHPRDDVRYEDQKEEMRKLARDNRFLVKEHTEMEARLESMKKKNSDIERLFKENQKLIRVVRKSSRNNRYLHRKNESLMKDNARLKNRRHITVTRVVRHEKETEVMGASEKKEDGDRVREQCVDMLRGNHDFIPLVQSVRAPSPEPAAVNPRPRKRRRYFEEVKLLPRQTRNGKEF